jgi:hypothetical protein
MRPQRVIHRQSVFRGSGKEKIIFYKHDMERVWGHSCVCADPSSLLSLSSVLLRSLYRPARSYLFILYVFFKHGRSCGASSVLRLALL